MEMLLTLLAAVMIARVIICTLGQQPCGRKLSITCVALCIIILLWRKILRHNSIIIRNATHVRFTFLNYVMTSVSEHL